VKREGERREEEAGYPAYALVGVGGVTAFLLCVIVLLPGSTIVSMLTGDPGAATCGAACSVTRLSLGETCGWETFLLFLVLKVSPLMGD